MIVRVVVEVTAPVAEVAEVADPEAAAVEEALPRAAAAAEAEDSGAVTVEADVTVEVIDPEIVEDDPSLVRDCVVCAGMTST